MSFFQRVQPAKPSNPLSGLAMRYMIGADEPGQGQDGTVTTVAYDCEQPVARGISVGYCNLYDETNSGKYGPYLAQTPTAEEYNETCPDPAGAGFEKNLHEQFARRKAAGFKFVDIDNPDGYEIKDVMRAIDLAASYGLGVIAKNPMLMQDEAQTFVQHPNVFGAVVEEDEEATPNAMDTLRRMAGKPDLPVWFIAFKSGRKWANAIAPEAQKFACMGVTYSATGEYAQVADLVTPQQSLPA